MVALARHLRVGTAYGLALSQVRGNLPKVVQKGATATEVLPAARPLSRARMGQYRAWLEAYGTAYLEAAAWTLSIALLSFVAALIWGAVLFFLRLNGGAWVEKSVDAYVQVLRNTPVLLPIYLIF